MRQYGKVNESSKQMKRNIPMLEYKYLIAERLLSENFGLSNNQRHIPSKQDLSVRHAISKHAKVEIIKIYLLSQDCKRSNAKTIQS